MIEHWNHDADPTELIDVTSYVKKFRENLKSNPNYLQKIVETHFKVCKVCSLNV